MQIKKLFSLTLALTAFTAVVSGCTLQQASDTASPSPEAGTASPLPAAISSPAGGSPDGGGTIGSAAAPSGTGVPAEANPAGAGEAHGGGQGPTAGAQAPVMGGGGGSMMPPMMAGNMSAPLAATPALDKKVADAEKAGDKKQIGAAYAARGTARMTDDSAGPRVKYRAALDDYRKALKADPSNAEATKYKKQIEDIYKSMGRPIPGA